MVCGQLLQKEKNCVKSVRIRGYSGPHFPVFGLNTEKYSASLRIQSECGKMRTTITLNTDTFHAVKNDLQDCNIGNALTSFSKLYIGLRSLG